MAKLVYDNKLDDIIYSHTKNINGKEVRNYRTGRKVGLMLFSIKHPEAFIIKSITGIKSYGGNQSWFPKYWARKAGCGATSAANIMAYLAETRAEFAKLYEQKSKSKEDYIRHMEVLFDYVKPGPMGVNHVDKYIKGVNQYVKSKGLYLKTNLLSVDKETKDNRTKKELAEFSQKAMELDAPIAFLTLSRGSELRLQDWHWITITSVQIEENHIWAIASDEGMERKFDLLLWYLTTGMHGGLIYYE